MSKILTSAFLLAVLTGPAMADVRPIPAPEITGGIIGMVFAAGIAVLLMRRRT